MIIGFSADGRLGQILEFQRSPMLFCVYLQINSQTLYDSRYQHDLNFIARRDKNE